MKRNGFLVGIDPDVSKSGFALLDCEAREFTQVEALPFPDVVDRFAELAALKVDGKDISRGHKAKWCRNGRITVTYRDTAGNENIVVFKRD